MKKLFALIAITCVINSYANNACIDNSWHLTRAFDNKDYHLVACTCPCAQYPKLANRAQCTKCRHFRDARPLIFITSNTPSIASAPTQLDDNAQVAQIKMVPSAIKRRKLLRSRAYAKKALLSPRTISTNFVK